MSEAHAEVIDERTGELVPMPAAQKGMVRAVPGDVAEAVNEYRSIQAQLDRIMPDSIMRRGDRAYRKKMYWRAVATAFNLSLEQTSERRSEEDGDWGYLVTYRATAPNGRFADGDGSCFASEKASGQDSVHNVRAHAHTRAKNRAISDLVGFGEVSAEEIGQQDYRATAPPRAPSPRPAPQPRTTQAEGRRDHVKELSLAAKAKAQALLDLCSKEHLECKHQTVETLAGAIRDVAFVQLGLTRETRKAKHTEPLKKAMAAVWIPQEGEHAGHPRLPQGYGEEGF